MMNMSPIEVAKQIAAKQGNFSGGGSSFFSLQDGESKVVRFLASMEPTYVVSHACGVNMIDVSMKAWVDAENAGQSMLCPQCGQPLTRDDIAYERPTIEGVHMHRFVATSDPNAKSNFACLGSMENAMFGITDANADGSPRYQCPICSHPSNLNKQGQPKKPSYRLYGIAVERDVKQEFQMINGIKTPVTVGVQDVYETDDEGKSHPKVVIVEMGWKGFWSKVAAYGFDSICYYDWRITRMGSGLDTTYEVAPMNAEQPNVVDMRQYEEWMPDVRGLLKGLASPGYYEKKGWAVPGYVAPQEDGGMAGAAQAMASNAFAPQPAPSPAAPAPAPMPAQPYAPAPMPTPVPVVVPAGGMSGWDAVSGQIQQ